MKTKQELTKEIIETTAKIRENYPELTKFEDEMTITIPSDVNSEITTSDLQEFNDSLQAMANGYAKSSIKHIVIIRAGFEGIKLARACYL